ncbi:hypothetical protein wVul_1123 [Wolbachia endosymbiont of Armadillidium vulgare str. wVulC]|uniref:Uncharacterized protein n=1 Tax=Wolbachia endosymbiont of Armadillidium arcangelii TaxID=3158571 RepID=A0AAU7Q5V2_9RICK|nr:hypothetical protein [Wolbachia endosymbiont of Armadillidium vulgare]KLT22189.1 hypothetical protein wVul_1123 [Wolbachia endosymbiont of Armadillidium vulgare str. wVulC]OJH31551.1 hypothetical protein Wxf_00943 [Wolbachia endosymbiont of Armadillidium vulgare]OJH32227.1 hypothetical protein Wxf_01654 [Wolbachia endosymbiont of Armadillidium vulgare]OJH32976.1 hypothetical protein Wxf_02440 [Wolbachia endosymbiont of Armadillidium vulgare]
MTGNTNLDSIIPETKNGQKTIKDLKTALKEKEVSSICDALKLVFATIPAFAALGLVVSMVVVWASESLAGFVLLGAIIASPLVGIAAGLITYFLDQDRKQAKAIEKPLALLEEAEVSEKLPLLQPSMQS